MRKIWEEKNGSRGESWKRGLESGDMSVAGSFQTGRRMDESEDQARLRWKRERAALVIGRPELATGGDVTRGLTPEAIAEAQKSSAATKALIEYAANFDAEGERKKREEAQKQVLLPSSGRVVSKPHTGGGGAPRAEDGRKVEVTGPVTINIDGSKDPKATAREVANSMQRGVGDKALRDAARATQDRGQ